MDSVFIALVWHILTLFGSGIVHVLNGLKNGTTQLLQQRLQELFGGTAKNIADSGTVSHSDLRRLT